MNIKLTGIALGQWRELTPAEMVELEQMLLGSSKTEEASDLSQLSEARLSEAHSATSQFAEE